MRTIFLPRFLKASVSRPAVANLPSWNLKLSKIMVLAVVAVAVPMASNAAMTTVSLQGKVDFMQEAEYGLARPIPTGTAPLLPFFNGATRVLGSYSYDPTAAVDTDPSSTAGQYVTPGNFTLSLPEIGLTLTSLGNLGFSVYPNGANEFHVNANATSTFLGNLGGAIPFVFSFNFYVPLGSDNLPTGAVPWQYGNLHIGLENVSPLRDIFIGVAPVPEPMTSWYMVFGLGGLAMVSRRKLLRPAVG